MASAFTSPYFLLLVACIAVIVGVGIGIWRHRSAPGATALVGLLAALFVWAAVYAVGLVTFDPGMRVLLERVMWIGVTAVPVTWLVFALEYTGYNRWISRRFVGSLAGLSVLMSAFVFTNPGHNLVWKTNQQITGAGVSYTIQTYGPLFWPFALYSYALVLAGSILFLQLVFTSDKLYPDQSVALVVGALVPLVANVASVVGLAPLEGFDLTPYAFTVSVVAFAYAQVRFEMFDFVPATRRLGRDAVIDNMLDAVLILDTDRRIVEANPVAEHAFDLERDELLGNALSSVLDADSDGPVLPEPGIRREVSTRRDGQTWEMTNSLLTDWQDRTIGHVLVFRDVTDRVFREQRLDVLNRVLRHNLRNDLNAIAGYAEILGEELSDSEAQLAGRIHDTAHELSNLGEKARAFDRAVEGIDGEPVEVDLVRSVTDAVETTRQQYPDTCIDTELPERLTVSCPAPELIDIIVGNLVENAVKHNESASPVASVKLAEDRESVPTALIVVSDNGPAIPRMEQEVLEAGSETQQRHGSGLGLWAVNWSVQRLGGELSIESGEEGNQVEVRLPREHRERTSIQSALATGE